MKKLTTIKAKKNPRSNSDILEDMRLKLGTYKAVASKLNVSTSTLKRWRDGKSKPKENNNKNIQNKAKGLKIPTKKESPIDKNRIKKTLEKYEKIDSPINLQIIVAWKPHDGPIAYISFIAFAPHNTEETMEQLDDLIADIKRKYMAIIVSVTIKETK